MKKFKYKKVKYEDLEKIAENKPKKFKHYSDNRYDGDDMYLTLFDDIYDRDED